MGDTFGQAASLCVIQSQCETFAAVSMRHDLVVARPLRWNEWEEKIFLQPFIENNIDSVEQLPHLELRVGGRGSQGWCETLRRSSHARRLVGTDASIKLRLLKPFRRPQTRPLASS